MTHSAPTGRTDISTEYMHCWLRPDGLEVIAWQPGFEIDVIRATEAVEAGQEVAGDRERGLLIDMRASGVMNRQARATFAGASAWVYAVALWVESPMSRVIANFFLGVSRSPRPTRMFTSEREAVAWLTANAP
jgi:hypothetical protein